MSLLNKLENHGSVLAWLQRSEGREFLAAIAEQQSDNVRKLKKDDNEKELLRLQGKIAVAQDVLDLENDIKQFQERKLHGILEQKRPTAGA